MWTEWVQVVKPVGLASCTPCRPHLLIQPAMHDSGGNDNGLAHSCELLDGCQVPAVKACSRQCRWSIKPATGCSHHKPPTSTPNLL